MMLYVFHVGVGRMFTFDMTVALSSVENLKENIQRLHGIPASNIVLMISGGEMLIESTQVSYYSAGTDTNPIYMFLTGEERLPTTLPPQIEQTDAELRRQVEESYNLPAVLETVRRRAQLAQHMYELARDEERQCERLVHEQHLQQQGWAAVVANLEDLTKEFRERFRTFCITFDQHLLTREKYELLLRNFSEDLTKLARVPILPGLMTLAEADFHEFDEFLDNDDVFSRSQMPQESVLMAIESAPKNENTNEGGVGVDGENNGVGISAAIDDDAKSSIVSTSPLKKPKMGDDHIEDDDNRPSTSAAAAAAAALAAATTADAQERISQNSASSISRRAMNMTLLQWITSKENPDSLQLMTAECEQGLGTFNVEIYERLKADVQQIIKMAEQTDVKEIKGLSDRLSKLEQMKYKVKQMVHDQKEISTSIQQNQVRASNLRDTSVLPDLCASHQSQLQGMLQSHQKIREFCRCIAKAKDELGMNLHMRLRRIVFIENSMSEFDNKLLFYHRCLRRAERHINIIEQIHRAPYIYVAAVTEVVRRRTFSGEFRKWASKLAEDFETIHSEEIRRRQEFNARFEGHFLNILFPGMHDMPPTFATENPLTFDTNLPILTRSDINVLSSQLPDVAPDVQLPDMRPVINFFVSRSGEHQRERMEELLQQKVAEALNLMDIVSEKQVPALQNQRITELQKQQQTRTMATGCEESETDTETEFEKVTAANTPALAVTTTVATSTSENVAAQNLEVMARSTSTEPLIMQNIETMTEENEATLRQEVHRLRCMFDAMSKVAVECISIARSNLDSVRQEVTNYQTNMQTDLQTVADKYKEVMQLAQNKQENEQQQDVVMKSSENDKCAMLEAEIDELREKLKLSQQEKDAAVAKAREELIQEHKTEIESLRCSFKRMTFKAMNMEHGSPTDTCLENLERPSSSTEQNVIDVLTHEQMLAQQRAELEAQKERAVSAALDVERSIWQTKLNSESVLSNVNTLVEMLEEKDRQLDLLREKDKLLTNENFQLKTRIDALTNEEGNSWLREKIDYLNRDKTRLELELKIEKARHDFEKHKYITLENCSTGDYAVVVWSIRHGQFVLMQDSPYLYFVHGDSLRGLKLNAPKDTDQIPIPFYAIGKIEHRQFCETKRDRNRYCLPKGTQFYRVFMIPAKFDPESKLYQDISLVDISGTSTLVSDRSFDTSLSREDDLNALKAKVKNVIKEEDEEESMHDDSKQEIKEDETVDKAAVEVSTTVDDIDIDGKPLCSSTPPASPTPLATEQKIETTQEQ